MAGVVAGESKNSHEKQDEVDMRGEDFAHEIPLDLMIEIMNRFPVKSLKRFQCVSKEWISIIQSRAFTDSFSSVSQTRPRFLVAVRTHFNRVLLFSSSSHESEVPKPNWLVNPVRYTCLHTNLEMTLSGLYVDLVICCSSIHGLFTLSNRLHPGRFIIYNPSTRQAITLPDNKASRGGRRGVHLLLGYDPVSNEYKALSTAGFFDEPFQEHKVLTLGGGVSGYSWRDIDEATKIPSYTVATNKICINGIVYCGVISTQEQRPLIIWFSVRDEKIGYIGTYSCIVSDGSLINYNGRLAAACPLPCDPINRFEIYILDKFRWLMTPFKVARSLSDLSGNIQLNILGRNKTDEFVLCPVKLPPKHEPLYIYYYNRGKDLIRRVELEGFEEFGCEHKSDEKCACQVLISAEHFETLACL